MNAPQKIEAADAKPFDSYGAYLREREYSHRLEELLSRGTMFLEMVADSREAKGQDVSQLREFTRQAREAFA
jgi:hypothetical protein